MTKSNTSNRDKTIRTRRSTRPRVHASLSLADAVGRDVVGELRGFDNKATRDDRFDVLLPNDVYRLLELTAIHADKMMQDTVAYCLKRGVRRLLTLPGISTIRSCRKAVVAAGSDDVDWFESFRFDVAARSGRKRRFFRKIDSDDVACCRGVARELGLLPAMLVTLAAMAILLEVAVVPDDKKRDILDELRQFADAVKKRAKRAEQYRTWAHVAPRPSLNFTFDDVVQDIREK